jgi:CARDB
MKHPKHFLKHFRRQVVRFVRLPRITSPHSLMITIPLALLLVAGAFVFSTSRNHVLLADALAPTSIGIGQGVAACGSSVTSQTCSNGTMSDTVTWDFTQPDQNAQNQICGHVIIVGGVSAGTKASPLPCAGSYTFNGLDPTKTYNYYFELNASVLPANWTGPEGSSGSTTITPYLISNTAGSIQASSSCATLTGTITATPSSSCTIAQGNTTCAVTLNWTTQNAQESVVQGIGGNLASGGQNLINPTTASSGSIPLALPAGQYAFNVAGYDGTNWQSNLQKISYTVNPPNTPDLTAGQITPTTAIAGFSTTFSATVTNTGSGSTINGFNNLFQVATGLDSNGNGTGVTDIALAEVPALAATQSNLTAVAMTALTAGSSATALDSYTFPSVGTYYMRVCANKLNSSTFDSIQESNYNNNCGSPWTGITVSLAGGGTLGGCTGTQCPSTSSTVICPTGNGCQVTFTWNCPSPYTGSTGNGFSTGGALSGSVTEPVTTNSAYSVTCTSPSYNAPPNVVTVSLPQAQLSLESSPSRVRSGSTSTLVWSATNVAQCSLAGPGVSTGVVSGDSNGTIATQNATTTAITGQTTYTLSCAGLDGNAASASTNVSLIPAFIEQ